MGDANDTSNQKYTPPASAVCGPAADRLYLSGRVALSGRRSAAEPGELWSRRSQIPGTR